MAKVLTDRERKFNQILLGAAERERKAGELQKIYNGICIKRARENEFSLIRDNIAKVFSVLNLTPEEKNELIRLLSLN